MFLPRTPEGLTHDDDGNLLSDGRWNLSWDAENRLTVVEARNDIPDGARKKLTFDYDWRGRRVSKTVSNWNATTSSYELASKTKFVYDGWRLLAELDANANLMRSYVWGTDLSSTFDSAGGVGGLAAMIDHAGGATYFYACDGNGNVRALVNAADGTIAARYDYGPFGELTRATGPMAKGNPFRWNTKYWDDETDFVMYERRPYIPALGRWAAREPFGEWDGPNLYAFCRNDPVNMVDRDGLESWQLLDPKNPPPWMRPPPPPVVPPAPPFEDRSGRGKDLISCCTPEKIDAGEQELKKRFKEAADELKKAGIKPVGTGKEGASCKNSSRSIIERLGQKGYPSCWQCYLEERNYYSPAKDPKDDRLDHQVVVCIAYDSKGKKKREIIFDWWGDTRYPLRRDQSGGPADKFRRSYPYPDRPQEQPWYSDCDGNPTMTPPMDNPWFKGNIAPK